MGSGPSLALSQADSPTEPGKPSIISEEIPHPFDAFWEEGVALLRENLDPQVIPVIKEVTVEEVSPDEFTTKVLLDGAKLNSYGLGNPADPNSDRVYSLMRNTVKKKECLIKNEIYAPHWVGEAATLQITAYAHFLQDPCRMEYWWIMPDGTRQADDTVQAGLQNYVNTVMAELVEKKVPCKFDKGKKCVISDAIDESIVTYDNLFDGLVDTMKEFPGSTVADETETGFKLMPPDAEKQPYSAVSFDKEKGSIAIDTFQPDGIEKVMSTYYSLSQNPVVLESYIEAKGARNTPKGHKRIVQMQVEKAIGKSSGGWFW